MHYKERERRKKTFNTSAISGLRKSWAFRKPFTKKSDLKSQAVKEEGLRAKGEIEKIDGALCIEEGEKKGTQTRSNQRYIILKEELLCVKVGTTTGPLSEICSLKKRHGAGPANRDRDPGGRGGLEHKKNTGGGMARRIFRGVPTRHWGGARPS